MHTLIHKMIPHMLKFQTFMITLLFHMTLYILDLLEREHAPTYLSDYVCNYSSNHTKSFTSGTIYPIASFHYFDNLSSSQKAFSMFATNFIEPRTYKEAYQHDY